MKCYGLGASQEMYDFVKRYFSVVTARQVSNGWEAEVFVDVVISCCEVDTAGL